MFTHVYLCLSPLSCVHLCLQLFSRACLHKFTHVYSCLPMFTALLTHADLSFTLFTRASLPMFTQVYSCLPMFTTFTRVY